MPCSSHARNLTSKQRLLYMQYHKERTKNTHIVWIQFLTFEEQLNTDIPMALNTDADRTGTGRLNINKRPELERRCTYARISWYNQLITTTNHCRHVKHTNT